MLSMAALAGGVSLGALMLATPGMAQSPEAPSANPQAVQEVAQNAAESQGSQNGSIENVTVVARRKEERLLDVPVAATVISPQALARYSVSNLTDVGLLYTDLNIQQTGQGSGSFIAVRGIGEGGDTSTDSSVSIDIDGVSTDRARGVKEDMFDLSSVQLLKGPQSLYFGKNSPAGVIVLNSADPTGTLSGYAKVGYEFNSQELYGEAAVGGPVNDQLKIRIAVRGDDMFGGWVYNNAVPRADPFEPGQTLPGNPNRWAPEWKTAADRFTAIWQPTANFDAEEKLLYTHYQDDGTASLGEIVRCVPGSGGGQFAVIVTFTDTNSGCSLNGVTDHGQNPASRLAHWNNGSSDYSWTNTVINATTLNYRFPDVTLTSVSGLYWYEEANYDSSDPTIFAAYGGYDTEDYYSLTEELRAQTTFKGPLNFSGGVFLQYEHMTLQTSDAIFDTVPWNMFVPGGVGPDPRNGWTNNFQSGDHDNGNTESAFGQVDYKVLPNVDITAGVRYTHEIKFGNDGYTFINETFAPFFPQLPVGQRLIGQIPASNWSPDATITWHPTKNLMLYAAYKTGFESGGFSNPTIIPAGTTAKEFEYKPELAKGEEVGLKASLLDGTLTGDLTLFSYDYTDLQVTQFFVKTTSFLIGNAAAARTEGVELQANWQATPSLSFHATAAYDKAYYLSFPGAECFPLQAPGTDGCAANGSGQNLAGQPFALAPLWQVNGGFVYQHPIWFGLVATVSADFQYNSGYQLGLGTELVQRPYWLVDAALHVTTPDNVWEVALTGRNLGNVLYYAGAGSTPLGPTGQFSGSIQRPQQINLEITRRF
jgi:iron complex outermembrane receptor protein